MKILAIETSTDTASLAGWHSGQQVWGEDFPAKRSLSGELAPRIAVGLEVLGGVDRIVVGLGPGSYAGVRIAIATAMGLQAVFGCELLGIPSPVAMQPLGAHFVVVGDARRGSWYFSEVTGGRCVIGPELVVSTESVSEKLVAARVPLIMSEEPPVGWLPLITTPQASVLAHAASAGCGIIQSGALEPLYLRDAHITRPTQG